MGLLLNLLLYIGFAITVPPGSAAPITDTSRFAYFPMGDVMMVKFTKKDEALITLFDSSRHTAAYVKGFGWTFTMNGRTIGLYEKDTVGKLVESPVKAHFLRSDVREDSRVIYSKTRPLHCEYGSSCMEAKVFSETIGLLKLNGQDYYNPGPYYMQGQTITAVGRNHEQAMAAAINTAEGECGVNKFSNYLVADCQSPAGTWCIILAFRCVK